MKLKALVAVAAFTLCGCSATPNQQYQIAAMAYDGAAIGDAVANDSGKVPPATQAKIIAGLAIAKTDLDAGASWLAANPNMANTVGMALPPLDPFNIALGLVMADLNRLNLVPTTPPATQPQK